MPRKFHRQRNLAGYSPWVAKSWTLSDSKFSLSFLWRYFLGSKITADGDCSHEIRRHLLLGRKAMTNLDSILKSRDVTANKVRIVKAVTYRCENWSIKKAECKELMLLRVC